MTMTRQVITPANEYAKAVISVITAVICFLAAAQAACAATLEFEEVLEKALLKAYEIRIAGVDVQIGEAAVGEAESLYYPTVNTRFDSEYAKDLTGGASQITSVGNTVLIDSTRYQNSLSLNATYNLYDFGVRPRKLRIAQIDAGAKKLLHSRALRDVKIKVLDLYRDLLATRHELEGKRETLSLCKSLLLMKERLNKAGLIPRTDMVNEAVKVAETMEEIELLLLRWKELFKELEFHTGDSYDPDNTNVAPLPDARAASRAGFPYERSLEFRLQEAEISKKQAELEIAERENLPKFGLYTNYIFYGSDPSAYQDSFEDIRRRNFFVGLSASVALFEGFRNESQTRRLGLELEKLQVEQERAVAELKKKHRRLEEEIRSYGQDVSHRRVIRDQTEQKLAFSERLSIQSISDQMDLISRRIELAHQKWELEKSVTLQRAAAKELEFLAEVPR